jgi:hypothetical protein
MTTKNKIEFSVNQEVTYRPYGKDVAAIVKEVDINGSISCENDTRVFYRLSGNANAVTSGLSIKESIYFEEVS